MGFAMWWSKKKANWAKSNQDLNGDAFVVSLSFSGMWP